MSFAMSILGIVLEICMAKLFSLSLPLLWKISNDVLYTLVWKGLPFLGTIAPLLAIRFGIDALLEKRSPSLRSRATNASAIIGLLLGILLLLFFGYVAIFVLQLDE